MCEIDSGKLTSAVLNLFKNEFYKYENFQSDTEFSNLMFSNGVNCGLKFSLLQISESELPVRFALHFSINSNNVKVISKITMDTEGNYYHVEFEPNSRFYSFKYKRLVGKILVDDVLEKSE